MRSEESQDKVISALCHLQALRKKALLAESLGLTTKGLILEMDQPMAILEAWLRLKDGTDSEADRDKDQD